MKIDADVIIVGAGNAAFCAAHAARENGSSVLVLERSPRTFSLKAKKPHRSNKMGLPIKKGLASQGYEALIINA